MSGGAGRRRRLAAPTVLLVVAAALTSCSAQPAPAAPAPVPTEHFLENTAYRDSDVSVDLSRSVGPFSYEPGRQLSATPKSWRFGAPTYDKLKRLRLARTRVWIRFTDAYDVTSRTPRYSALDDYLRAYHDISGQLVVDWLSMYDPLVTSKRMTEDELFGAERDMLAYYKRKFPKIGYLESENEPASITAYYPQYRLAYRLANAVNGMRLPGPPIRVGGPTLDTFSQARLSQFLDLYQADRSGEKRLDFISYHQYLINTDGEWHTDKDNPAVVGTERRRVDALLARRDLASVPILVTETGMFPAGRESNPQLGLDVDLHIQAAGLTAMHYYYAGQRDVIPFDWTVDHPDNDRKDLFADLEHGVARPYYNATLMASMLPATRFQASTSSLSSRGIGTYAMAGADPDRVAVMTWNYQWTYGTAYESRITLKELPERFRSQNIRVECYRIAADVHSGDLAMVQKFVIGPRPDGFWIGPPQPLGPNELRLMVLTPTDDPPTAAD
jgi:hypothetical protein